MIIAPPRLHLRGAPDAKPPGAPPPLSPSRLLSHPSPLGDGGWDKLILSEMLSAMAEIEVRDDSRPRRLERANLATCFAPVALSQDPRALLLASRLPIVITVTKPSKLASHPTRILTTRLTNCESGAPKIGPPTRNGHSGGEHPSGHARARTF